MFFTEKDEAMGWAQDASRRGDTVVSGSPNSEMPDTPFDIVLGVDGGDNLERIYIEENTDFDSVPSHTHLLGSYTVYESKEAYDKDIE